MKRYPNFIIIGAMKCGTSTLHEQLAQQAGIWMSTPKEPCFFSDDEQWARGVDWYQSLFAGAPSEAICGEASTHYTKRPTYQHTVKRMRQLLPNDVRFIYVMRDPIDRLVSQYIHEWTQRVIQCPLEQAVKHHPELIAYSRYAMQIEPYLDAFGQSRILPMFLEHLSANPQSELQRACEFIGWAGKPLWKSEKEKVNASDERMRRCAWRDALIGLPGVRRIGRAVLPKKVRRGIQSFWMMSGRPQLSLATMAKLMDVFDEDLARLSARLGVDLRCRSFKEIAARTAPQWVGQFEQSVA